MKVAIDISQIVYGTGVSRYTKELVTNLLKLDEDLKLTLFGGSLRRRSELVNFSRRLPHTKLKTLPLPPSVLNHLWNTFHLIPIETFIGNVDLVHTSDWAEPPSKLPKITTVHDLGFMKDTTFSSTSIRQVHRKRLYWATHECKKIIAVSQATKNDLLTFFDIQPENIEVVYEAPTLSAPSVTEETVQTILNRYGIQKPYLLVPGAGNQRKNLARIISAFKPFSDKYTLVIIGRPSQEEATLIRNTKNVYSPGFVADSDLTYIFSQAEALVYPSLYEGFGLPVLDAFVCSIPVVTSNVSSLPEIAGKAAVLVDPKSKDEITDGIRKALKDRDRLTLLGHEQLKNFSWKKTAKETYNIYKAVLNS